MEIKKISAKETYALRSQVLRPGLPLEANFYPKDEEGWHFGLWDGKWISVVTAHPEDHPQFSLPGQWRIRGMATLPEFRGKGLGTLLLQHLLRETQSIPLLWCNARTPALSFYLRHGFTVESEEFSLPHIGPHRLMKRISSSGGRKESL